MSDFEVLSKDQWFLLVKYFSERLGEGEASEYVPPVALMRTYELLGLGIRTQIEYFLQEVSLIKYKNPYEKHSDYMQL